jgi:hypothetical protein
VLPQQVDTTKPGGVEVRTIRESAWRMARQVNELRKDEGTGHGRTLASRLDPDTALYVVREECGVADFILGTLDRQFGRR